MKYLEDLNPPQQAAVLAGTGPVLVLAGPGSGKTRVLTRRIVHLISDKGVNPYNILAVTFTNKAAREMENRVIRLIGENTGGLTLGTFHATCARILRREAGNLPFETNYVIFDADDQVNVVKQALKDLDIDDKRYRPRGVHHSISKAKNDLYLPDDIPVEGYRDEIVKRVYSRYQELLLTSNALDFDDLLLWTAYLLEEFPKVRDKYARRFEHVLVDEFQDTNLAQYILLSHLSSFHKNIFAVGDTDQSIYRWRGADYRNVLRFEKDFPDTQVILLEQNYRSTQQILDVAMAVINRHPQRTAKNLFTSRPHGAKVILHDVFDDREEADFVIKTIGSTIQRTGASPGDFAIMYRTNAQSRMLEEAFLRAGLPYKLVGAQRFYGRREVKDIIAYLRLLHNLDDEISLGRVINTPRRGIGDKTLFTLRTQAQRHRRSSGSILYELGENPDTQLQESFPRRSYLTLTSFSNLLHNWSPLVKNAPPLELMDTILKEVDYQGYIDDGTEEGHERWENVMELRRLASEYQEKGLEAFLEQVALVSDQDTLDASVQVPTMLTMHAAKGLEFPTVMIVGLNEGTLPHSRSFDDNEEMLEERRLFYVGITRAKNKLYLVSPQNRSFYGYPEPVDPSRFLDEIPADLLQISRSPRALPGFRPSLQSRRTQWGTPTSAEPQHEQKYHPGMRVQHPTWGEGMVLNSRIENDDEVVDVFFEELGLKRLAASLARLEIVS